MTVRDVVFDDGDLVLKKGTIGTVVDVAKSKDGKEYVSFETEDPRYAVFPVFQLAPPEDVHLVFEDFKAPKS
jgi:hypothetical protein